MQNGYVIEGGAEGNGPAHGQGQTNGPLPHPVPASQAGGGTGQPPNGTAASTGYPDTLLPSGSQVVGFVDRAATRIPWWAWLVAGAAGYHFIIARPIWKARKGS